MLELSSVQAVLLIYLTLQQSSFPKCLCARINQKLVLVSLWAHYHTVPYSLFTANHFLLERNTTLGKNGMLCNAQQYPTCSLGRNEGTCVFMTAVSNQQRTLKLNRKLFQFIRSKFWPGGVRFTIISWSSDRTYFNALWTRSFFMRMRGHQHKYKFLSIARECLLLLQRCRERRRRRWRERSFSLENWNDFRLGFLCA